MNNSDCAIITPSVIAYEAMYLNLPFLAIQTTDNQRYISDYLSSNKFLLGHAEALNNIKPLIQSLLTL
jgi:UDP-2,4-diacetamido-2,4,6-trideoxy-beta-L-altropyranose hydrolase